VRCKRFVIRTESGVTGVAVVCGNFRPDPTCATIGCGAVATIQCDWKLTGRKKAKTCDRWLCAGCATSVGENKDLCPPHARAWDAHPANPKNAASSP
jgi:hypothetical protein